METTKSLMLVAVLAVALAAVATIVVVVKMNDAVKTVGYAQQEFGNATLEVIGVANIVFLNYTINWSDGSVDVANFNYANLTTNATVTYAGGDTSAIYDTTCTADCNQGDGFTFNNVTQGLIIENRGATQVSLNLASDVGADEFVCNNNAPCVAYTPVFQWELNQDPIDGDGEAGSCTGSFPDTSYTDVSTGAGKVVCSIFENVPANNELEVDLSVHIPQNAPVGVRWAEITATATVI